MRIKDYDLNLSPNNKKVYYPINLDTPLESYYHSASHCSLYDIDNEKVLLFLDNFENLRKPEFLQNKHIVIEEEINRIDKISYKYYKSPELWWIIAEVNYIDPFELYVGQELFIPSLREFDFISMNKDNFKYSSDDKF